ncbi:MAG: hypothetical protein HY741_13385 [Chloroflexi bacterium]|nr:hypothetical protein [Chloroflexota bacterium]
MMRPPSPRAVKRRGDELLIFLHPDEWANDVPLPEGSVIVEMGENDEIPFFPQWHFALRPKKTIEVLVGWFKIPLGFEKAVSWYEAELESLGWVQDLARGYSRRNAAHKPEAVGLRFQHPQTGVRVEISVQLGSERRGTTAMIRRIVEHPWSPPSKGNGAGARASAKPAARSKKRRAPRKARRRVIA